MAFSSVKGADIESLFSAEECLTFYNGCFGTTLALKDLNGTGRIVKRIARKEGEFNHGQVAAHFLRNLDSSLASLSSETLLSSGFVVPRGAQGPHRDEDRCLMLEDAFAGQQRGAAGAPWCAKMGVASPVHWAIRTARRGSSPQSRFRHPAAVTETSD